MEKIMGKDDTISRQDAINTIMGQPPEAHCPSWYAEQIKKLPSAQPEQRLSCKNCVHLGHGYMMPCKNCKRNQMLPDWYEVETERKKND